MNFPIKHFSFRRLFLLSILLALFIASCVNFEDQKTEVSDTVQLMSQIDSLKNLINNKSQATGNQLTTFLTFQDNNAENAMNYYVDLFQEAEIMDIKRWGNDAPVEEGRIMQARFQLNGQHFMCSDSPPVHEWGFSPAVSIYVECTDEEEMQRLFEALSDKGEVMMPPGNYGFSQKFAWVADKFGVSWQLNLQ
jgi:predicted 3-demethylubiquinone-9 3-methyltransferase (glyoxalase superfamily)